MDSGLLIALITAGATLGGVGLAQWSAMRAARLQASQQIRLEELRQHSQAKATATALWFQKREEFLNLVLLAQAQVLRMADGAARGGKNTTPVEQSPAIVARQAYAVALLYLDDMHQSAKAYAEATAKVQLALDASGSQAALAHMDDWAAALRAIEVGIKMHAATLAKSAAPVQ